MLRAILLQIIYTRPKLFSTIAANFSYMMDSRYGIRWTLNDLQDILVHLVRSSPQTKFLFLVDALDEYQGDDSTIAAIVIDLASRCPSNLQLCVSSRPHVDFRKSFGSCIKLHMEYHTGGDIRKYTHGIFQSYIQRHGGNYRSLVDDMISNAQGLFIWVKLASNEILRAAKRGEDISQLQSRLDNMPQDLDEFYQRILNQLDAED